MFVFIYKWRKNAVFSHLAQGLLLPRQRDLVAIGSLAVRRLATFGALAP